METTNELIKAADAFSMEAQTANILKEKFLPFFDKATEWKNKAATLVVTDISQVNEMRLARQARLALKDIRVNAEKTRKELKEDSLRYGKAVQGMYNVIEFLIVPIENHLEKQENFAAIKEAERKAELKEARGAALLLYSEFVPFGIDLGAMKDEDYLKTFEGARLQFEAKEKAELEAKEAREAQAKADAIERDRVKKENEKLRAAAAAIEIERAKERAKAKAAADAIEVKAKKDREAAAVKLKAEREAREKAERELKEKAAAATRLQKEADAKAAAELKAKQEAERKAKAAPDKEKLKEFANFIDRIGLPVAKSEDGQKIVNDAKALLTKVSNFIRERTANI